ncbi:MAG: hydrogenase nickel incorporation protein HypB [Proteobacteria bacterium]|nr:hydrogenase nickel incorporation protein HypB [Pseudomonadota bacterium]
MCLECGCAETGEILIDGKPLDHSEHHHHHHLDESQTDRGHGPAPREISIQRNILEKNDRIAQHNREHLAVKNVFSMNWISAPGSGKTALLERLITDFGSEFSFSVIEGDQQTDNDAQRIRRAGADAVQINTGAACHLDAEMIHHALHRIELDDTGILIIENVGNMVCPAAYDLGEMLKVAVISCPEGEDKPIKYPDLLLASHVLLVNKIDLIPHLDFSLENCIAFAKNVNPEISIFPVSAKTREGVDAFFKWLTEKFGLQ